MGKGRIILIAVAALVVVAVAGVLVLRGRLDDLVARAIEHHGSRLCGTAVTVGMVHLELGAGRATIRDVAVANPEGFSQRPALAFGEFVIDLDPGSLTGEPYVIENLDLKDAAVLYEVDAAGRRNLDVIKANLQAAAPASGGGEAAPAPLLVVGRLAQSGGRVAVDASALGVGSRTAELGGFALTDLGAPNGAPATAIGKQALQKLIGEAARAAVNDELKSRLEDLAGQKTGELGGQVKDKLDDLIGK
jgi:hypothetical protein